MTETPTLDEADLRILSALQADASLTNLDLAARVHLSPAPCLRRRRALEEAGVIRGYVAQLDRERLGLHVRALAFVKLESHRAAHAKQFEQVVQGRAEVQECLRLSGEHDYLLRIVVPSMAAYSAFMDAHLLSLPGVRSVNTSFELGALKETTALPLPVPEQARRRSVARGAGR